MRIKQERHSRFSTHYLMDNLISFRIFSMKGHVTSPTLQIREIPHLGP